MELTGAPPVRWFVIIIYISSWLRRQYRRRRVAGGFLLPLEDDVVDGHLFSWLYFFMVALPPRRRRGLAQKTEIPATERVVYFLPRGSRGPAALAE